MFFSRPLIRTYILQTRRKSTFVTEHLCVTVCKVFGVFDRLLKSAININLRIHFSELAMKGTVSRKWGKQRFGANVQRHVRFGRDFCD